jgi:uncharacterized protein YjlB
MPAWQAGATGTREIRAAKGFKMQTLDQQIQAAVRTPVVVAHTIGDNGPFPNNPQIPLLTYQGVIDLSVGNAPSIVEQVIWANEWGHSWRNGVYSFHHYHSTAHEVLGIYSGKVRVQFGGEGGIVLEALTGDVIIIPAGVSHKNLGASRDFGCVGAYPLGQRPDIKYGEASERPQVDDVIAHVPLPTADPVFGIDGPLTAQWIQSRA